MQVVRGLSRRPKVIAFDAYGTLLDVHSAVDRLSGKVGPDAAQFSMLWRTKQLEYSWVRALAGRYVDFWQLTQDALAFALARFPSVDPGLTGELLEAYRHLSAYPDVAPALRRLRSEGFALCIFSNGEPGMLDAALTSAGLTAALDAALSVDAIRTFKTAPSAYRMVCDRFNVAAQDAVLVSSNRWDIAGACAAGLPGIWVNRTAAPDEYADLPPVAVVSALSEL
jgi:2-haloacid dehalogenase